MWCRNCASCQSTYVDPRFLVGFMLLDLQLVLCVMFSRSLFIPLSFIFWTLCGLSFFFWTLCGLSFFFWTLCGLFFFFWTLCGLSFFDVRFLITHLVSSDLSCCFRAKKPGYFMGIYDTNEKNA